MKKLLFLPLLYFSLFSGAQTFTNTTGASIPDAGPMISIPINVTGLTPSTIDTIFGLESVCINITHTYDADLTIQIQSPNGQIADLSINNGGGGDDYTSTCFNMSAGTNITNGNPPFTGTFKPQGQLGNLNNGQLGNGTWNLLVQDTWGQDTGKVISCSITFGNNPAKPFSFKSSDIPIVIINTNGQTIQNGVRIIANMGIIDNGPGNRNYINDPLNHYNGKIGIEIRGQSSTMFPQKQYNVETMDASGTLAQDVSIFNMPLENDWVLYAPYTDKMLMRNVLTYKLSRDLGHWAARTRFCEVVIDSNYQGIYVFMEKVKRDSNRVSVKKMLPTDNTGDNVTGGYIFSIDKDAPDWYSPISPIGSNSGQTIGFHHIYPKNIDITVQQSNYLSAYVDSFEQALNGVNYQDPLIGYRKYASVKSFVDYFLINEISNNVDGYRLSTFLHKDRNSKGGQLKAGPHWDYNLAWHNADYCAGDQYNVWAYQFNNVCSGDYWQVPFWWEKLVTDSAFQNKTYCRWQQLRQTILDTVNLFAVIDSMSAELNESKDRHFTQWPILGTYVWPNPSPLATSYEQEVRQTKDWIINRLNWLDANMIGSGPCAPWDVSTHFQENTITFSSYPNPFQQDLSITVDFKNAGTYLIELYDATGRKICAVANDYFDAEDYTFVLPLRNHNLKNGLYFARISGEGINKTFKLIRSN